MKPHTPFEKSKRRFAADCGATIALPEEPSSIHSNTKLPFPSVRVMGVKFLYKGADVKPDSGGYLNRRRDGCNIGDEWR